MTTVRYFGGPCDGEEVLVESRDCPYVFIRTTGTDLHMYRNDTTRFSYVPPLPPSPPPEAPVCTSQDR